METACQAGGDEARAAARRDDLPRHPLVDVLAEPGHRHERPGQAPGRFRRRRSHGAPPGGSLRQAGGIPAHRDGLELKPVIIALTEWGDKWVRPGPVEFRNEADGQPVELRLRRVGDAAEVAIGDVVARRR